MILQSLKAALTSIEFMLVIIILVTAAFLAGIWVGARITIDQARSGDLIIKKGTNEIRR